MKGHVFERERVRGGGCARETARGMARATHCNQQDKQQHATINFIICCCLDSCCTA